MLKYYKNKIIIVTNMFKKINSLERDWHVIAIVTVVCTVVSTIGAIMGWGQRSGWSGLGTSSDIPYDRKHNN